MRRGIPGPWQRSLLWRLVGSFLVISALTVTVVGVVAYVRATADLTRSVYDRLESVVEVKADALDRWVDEQRRNVVFVGFVPGFGDDARTLLDPASGPADRDAAEAELRRVLDTVVKQTADAQEIFILDLDGTVRLATVPAHEGRSEAAQEYFTSGLSNTALQSLYTSSLTNEPTMTVSTPLFDRDGLGRRVGVLAANLNLDRVDRIVAERTGLGQTGGTRLGPLEIDNVVRNYLGRAPATAVTQADIDAAIALGAGRAMYANRDGTPVIGVYRWLEEFQAPLIAEMSQAEAFAPARDLAATIAIVGLVSALLLAVAIWLVARRVTRPILGLAATATAVAAGDLTATAPVMSEDEVGTLTTAFNDMTAQLRENVETLERRVDERTAELARQKMYFESLVEISPAAVVTMELDERVTGWNPAATRLFGFTPEEAIGRPIDELVLRSAELREEGHAVHEEAARTGHAARIAQRMRKDGTTVDVEIVMVPLVVEEEMIGFYAVYHDITELEAARREADAANHAKSTFLAAMSHEIRTPMNAIIGMSGLLGDTPLDREQRDYTETIQTSAESLLTIINDILDFSKIEAGRIELLAEPTDLRSVVEGALDVMAPTAARKGVELVFAVDDSVPPAVAADPGRLRQIILNLLSNSVKFTETGEVELSVAARPIEDDDRVEIQLDVRDTGIGITPEQLGRLFQSFSQADATISRRFGGTGLGLAISRRLAEAMDGSLTAESEGIPGRGSTFHLVVRLRPTESVVTAPAPVAIELAGRRAMVVDDNATNRRILVAQLARWGMVALETGSPDEALEWLARDGGIDVVLTDLAMPTMDGSVLAARMREVRPSVPIVLLSSIGDARGGPDAMVAAVLSKPVKPAALRETLDGVLGGGAPAPALRPAERGRIEADLATSHPHRILLAEDNPVNQKLALRLLERMGYAADAVGDGLAAIDALEREPYDLVLMDIQMPELDGLEATRRIRSTWPDRPVRIVAMTANAMEGDREACLAAGMDDYLSKPIRVDELVAELTRSAPSGSADRDGGPA